MSSDPNTARLEKAARTMALPGRVLSELRSGESSDAEIADVLEAFMLSIKPKAASQWLENPVPALKGQTPSHMIKTGRAAEVRNLLIGLADGIFI